MAKVVKFCAACEEGFAEKFGFCPNCGGALTAYELNPVAEKPSVEAPKRFEAKAPAPVVLPVVNESPAYIETPVVEPEVTQEFSAIDDDDEFLEYNEAAEVEEIIPEKVVASPVAAAAPAGFTPSYNQSAFKQNGSSNGNGYQKTFNKSQAANNDGGYHITFVEEKNASGRNLLLLGAFMLITSAVFGGLLYSLFEKNLNIGALGSDDSMMAYIGPVEPDPIEPEPPQPKNNDKGGGGGGGGKENPTPANKGRTPDQVEKPIMPPQPMPQVTNASLPNPNQTQGKVKTPPTNEPVGFKVGGDTLSSGPGSGGGMGSGRGTGAGGGIGTGNGNGIGSGTGNGNGNGNGNGTGDGDNGDRDAPPPVKKGPPEPMRILSKPRPSYTDAARQNQVTGVVRLKVTFMANGTIGSVTPVSGLSYGLTEQAIAAAKQIKFEPQKVGGVAQTVSKTIEYSFSIY